MFQRDLAARPNLEQYKKQAKELARDYELGETAALARVRLQGWHGERAFALADAQWVIAQEMDFESWPKLAAQIRKLNLIEATADLQDPVADFLEVACVPRNGSHGAGDLEHAEMILAQYPEVRGSNVYVAAVLGDQAVVRRFLEGDAGLATAKGPGDWDALTRLCFSRYLRLEGARDFVGAARALLEAGADANTGWHAVWAGKPEFESAIYGAAGVAQHEGVTRVLLEFGADPNDNETAYHVAETYENGVVKVLLESGKFNEQSLVTLLVRKADFHDIAGMRMVLEHGGNPNWTPMWGASALLHALLRDNRLAMIELLLDFGAEMSVRSTRYEMNGFALAARRGRGDVLEMLERRGVALEFEAVDAVIAACARGDLAAAERLVAGEPGIREEIVAEGGKLLADFGGNGNVAGVRCLLAMGARADAVYGAIGDGYWDLTPTSTPLHVAAWRGWAGAVKELLAGGAPVNALDGNGRTALQMAVRACVDSYWMERRTPESVQALLEAGATLEGVKVPCGYDEVDELLREYRARRG